LIFGTPLFYPRHVSSLSFDEFYHSIDITELESLNNTEILLMKNEANNAELANLIIVCDIKRMKVILFFNI
jgi:hypothetical protein